MPERDPRTDPKPGDTLRLITQPWLLLYERTVISVGCEFGTGVVFVEYFPFDRSDKKRSCRREAWRKWAKDATVVRLGKK